MDEETYYFHGRTRMDSYDRRTCRFTVAGRFTKSNTDTYSLMLVIGVSLCSPQDQFCKATGRVKASGRTHCEGLIAKGKSTIMVTKDDIPTELRDDRSERIRLFVEIASKYNMLTRRKFAEAFQMKLPVQNKGN